MGQPSQDSFGNYLPNPGTPTYGSGVNVDIPVSFAGNPNGVVSGSLNQIGVDIVGKAFYINTDGGTTWTAISSGGGGGQIVTVDPNGVTTGSAGSLAFNKTNSTFWVNTDGNKAWTQLI